MILDGRLQVVLLASMALAACGQNASGNGAFGSDAADDGSGAADALATGDDATASSSGAASSGSSGGSGATSGGASGGSASSTSSGSSASSGSSSGPSSSGASSSGGSTGSSTSSSSSGASSASSTSSSSSSSSSGSSGGPCTYGTPVNATGSFTWYYFGQGTGQQNGYYLTACGYQGTESGMVDSVQNVASTGLASASYFAAIPGSSGFNTVNDCGACVEITNGAKSIIATIIDECPTDNGQNPLCAMAGHLDLSYAAWQALGYPSGNPSGTSWKFVSCPVTGNITTRLKSGNTDQLYIENTVLPIVSITYNGVAANHLSYGAWQLPNGAAAAGATLVLTDVEGHTVTITVPGGGGATNGQFPNRCP